MALVEKLGNVVVHGRFDGLQVLQDAYDTEVAAPAGSTHAEIHQETQFQRIFFSLDGAVNSWRPLPPGARDSGGTPFRVALGAATKIYLRKARQIRQLAADPGLAAWGGADARERVADDVIGKVTVTFTED